MFKLEVDSVPMKVVFQHGQIDDPSWSKLLKRHHKRGITVADLVLPDGHILASARAWCYKQDNFRKETGRKHALKFLLEKAYPGEQNKELRKQFWDAYFSRH